MTITWIDQPDIEYEGKRVFCRVDFNVPIDEAGQITDGSRIVAALPTIRYLVGKGARLILASHLGRPQQKGRHNSSLEPVAERLSELLESEVIFADDCIGDGIKRLVSELAPGKILVCENLRYYPEEEKNDEVFARKLAANADIYVDDAFGALHRAHASTAGIAAFVPIKLGGFLLRKEIEALEKLRRSAPKPFVAIIGGAKVSDKMGVLNQLVSRVDKLLIGGAMAYTFLKAQGKSIGASRCEDDRLSIAQSILNKAKQNGVEVLLPIDHVAATEMSAGAKTRVVNDDFEDDEMGLDIGPRTIERFCAAIPDKGTVFWNGPMGVFELEPFSHGTMAVMRAVANSGAYTVVGGGDSVAALNKSQEQHRISHISTGGGASLEFLEGKRLPGLDVLGY